MAQAGYITVSVIDTESVAAFIRHICELSDSALDYTSAELGSELSQALDALMEAVS